MNIRLSPFLALALGACAFAPSGEPLRLPAPSNLLALHGGVPGFIEGYGSATIIAPGIAATAAHEAGTMLTGFHTRYAKDKDLAFFPARDGAPLVAGSPHLGDYVTVYGNSYASGPRVAHGRVIVEVIGMCAGEVGTGDDGGPAAKECARRGLGMRAGFVIDAPTGAGMSGGPVLNQRGEWIGITTQRTTVDATGREGAFCYYAGTVIEAQKEAK